MLENQKNYICVCGRKFINSQSFNAHKGHCEKHQLLKYGSLSKMKNHHKNIGDNCHKTSEIKRKIKENSELTQWISEQHTCEKCGKVMTEKFGSGRFCSPSCANSRNHSEETKKKISNSVKNNPNGWASTEWRELHPDGIRTNHSKRELEIINYLKENFPDDDWKQGFVSQGVIKVNDKNYYINPDLHSDKLKVVIEYDGIWHFKDINNQLEQKQLVDRLTYQWCKDHNYRLIRIDSDLNIPIPKIVDSIYNGDADLELFGSERYSYLIN